MVTKLEVKNRKIDLGENFSPMTGETVREGNPNCGHDFERDKLSCNEDRCGHWSCTKCPFTRCYEYWD